MWDSVPWFIGGGAHHSPEVARLLAYAATGGAEGVVTPGDLKVAPLDVPGSSVRVLAGACLILNKAAGGAQQTYVGRNPSVDVAAIAATGSASGRSDLVVARVEDPFMPGEPWADPADPTSGPYIFTRIIPNVAPGTTTLPSGMSGIPLARIDIPPNTATITAGMIKDLRKLARPRSTRFMESSAASFETLTATADWVTWPSYTAQVEVPTWATHADMRVTISGIAQLAPMADALLRAHIGNSQVSGQLFMDSDKWQDGIRHSVQLGCSGPLLESEKGKVITLKVSAIRSAWDDGIHTGTYRVDQLTHVCYDIQFSEKAV